MDSVLIVSCSEKGTEFIRDMLSASDFHQVAALQSCGEARRLFLQRSFDLVIVNAPLRDESGENFSREIACKGLSQVMLVVKSEYFDAVSAIC